MCRSSFPERFSNVGSRRSPSISGRGAREGRQIRFDCTARAAARRRRPLARYHGPTIALIDTVGRRVVETEFIELPARKRHEFSPKTEPIDFHRPQPTRLSGRRSERNERAIVESATRRHVGRAGHPCRLAVRLLYAADPRTDVRLRAQEVFRQQVRRSELEGKPESVDPFVLASVRLVGCERDRRGGGVGVPIGPSPPPGDFFREPNTKRGVCFGRSLNSDLAPSPPPGGKVCSQNRDL